MPIRLIRLICRPKKAAAVIGYLQQTAYLCFMFQSHTRMKKIITFLLAALLATAMAWAQQLPQFTSTNFEGWIYNNPGITLSTAKIAGGKIVLYTNRQGLVLTLTSPLFSCQEIDSIQAYVIWYTSEFNNSSFELSKTALTMALDDEQGQPLDSATVVPTVLGSTHNLILKLAVPSGTTAARLRFVSWKADIISSGAIKQALITAITASPHGDDPIHGDIDNNGVVNISDVTTLIHGVLGSIELPNSDIDGNGVVNVTDVTLLIDIVLNH